MFDEFYAKEVVRVPKLRKHAVSLSEQAVRLSEGQLSVGRRKNPYLFMC
jgi:hypothetical protein